MKTTEQSDLVFNVEQVGHVLVAKGLTKREYFSACALQGLLANSFDSDDFIPLPKCKMEFISLIAVQHADKLIEELNK